MRKLRMYKSALFLVSWFPKGLGLDVPTSNSKGLTLRPGMQEELRTRGTKTKDPLRPGVFAREKGLFMRTGLGDLSHKRPDFLLLSWFPQEEKVLIHESRPVPVREWLITPTCLQHLSTAR